MQSNWQHKRQLIYFNLILTFNKNIKCSDILIMLINYTIIANPIILKEYFIKKFKLQKTIISLNVIAKDKLELKEWEWLIRRP